MTNVTIHHTGPIVTRREANLSGSRRYFNGIPCPRGHIAQRQTSNGVCIECNRGINRTSLIKITYEELVDLLVYDPLTGVFTRNRKSGKFPSGSVVGTVNDSGYLIITIKNRRYRAHQLAFLYMTQKWPEGLMDHKNLNRLDNSWDNLRLATSSQNGANCLHKKNSKSGIKGVYFAKNQWHAKIQVNYRIIPLGDFDDKLAAALAYRDAAIKYFGEFARSELPRT